MYDECGTDEILSVGIILINIICPKNICTVCASTSSGTKTLLMGQPLNKRSLCERTQRNDGLGSNIKYFPDLQ